ncbi:MAG TPA: beta-galactosidase [Lactobacillus sp.]|nr:beta-galactosidase [Lactobacillus sp.]
MEPDMKWLDDPQVFRVGQLPAHSDHYWYRDEDEARAHKSSWTQSLDGQWQFKFSDQPAHRPVGFYEQGYDTSDFGSIQVPSHIELSNYAQLQYINTLYPWEGKIYRRPAYTMGPDQSAAGMFSEAPDNSVGDYIKHFRLASGLADQQRVIVQFDGVEEAMYVWLNGHFLGYSEDSFSRAEFDLTDALVDGDNVLAVAVFKRSTASFLEDQDMFRFSGIFRSVRLVGVPRIHVDDLNIRPVVHQDLQDGELSVGLKLNGAVGEHARVHLTVFDKDDKLIIDEKQPVSKRVSFDHLPVSNVILWTHHNPYLYHLMVTIVDDAGDTIEAVPYEIGFRRLELRGQVIYLNGKRLVINGVNRHEWDATTGRAVSMADMKADLQTFADNHINAVRTCHYPDQIPWYYMCDQAGIYMMAENNLETHGTWQKMGAVEPSDNVPGSLPQWRDAVLDRARNNYEAFKNHPAVLFWSLGNESYAGDDIEAMNTYYKAMDASRLTHYEGVVRNRDYETTISDVESRMYASPAEIRAYLSEHPTKPFLDCEYMHDMGNSLGGLGEYMALLDDFPSYQGGFIWDFIDQALWVTDEVTGRQVLRYGGDFDDRHTDGEFSGDGLMFANRQAKPAMQEVRYYYGQYDN